jgi:hypothetical protein
MRAISPVCRTENKATTFKIALLILHGMINYELERIRMIKSKMGGACSTNGGEEECI